MTPLQRTQFYFPAWHSACAANGWRVVQKRLLIDPDRLTDEGRKVATFASQLALTAHRAVTLDDLRHGAHVLALGRDKSSEHLTNAETDRVVCLFKLLTDPEDLDAVMKWQAYQRGEDPGEVKRLDWAIKHAAPDAYARKVSEDKFGSRMWEWLSVLQKRQLVMTLKARNKARHSPITNGPERRPPARRLEYVKGPF